MPLRDKIIFTWMIIESLLLFFIGWQFAQIKNALLELVGKGKTIHNRQEEMDSLISEVVMLRELKDCVNCRHIIKFKSTKEYERFVKTRPDYPCITCELDEGLNNWHSDRSDEGT